MPLARHLLGLGLLTTHIDEADALIEFTCTLIESEAAAIGCPTRSRQRSGSAARRSPWYTGEVCALLEAAREARAALLMTVRCETVPRPSRVAGPQRARTGPPTTADLGCNCTPK